MAGFKAALANARKMAPKGKGKPKGKLPMKPGAKPGFPGKPGFPMPQGRPGMPLSDEEEQGRRPPFRR